MYVKSSEGGTLPTGSDVLTSDFLAEPDSTLCHLAIILTSVVATTLHLTLEAGQSHTDGWMSVRTEGCNSFQSGHSCILPALNFQPAATPEPDGLYGNQCYRRELLMMGIMVPETM